MSKFVPQLRATIMLSGCGHWTQQERATEVNATMIDFLRGLPTLIAPVDRRRRCQLM